MLSKLAENFFRIVAGCQYPFTYRGENEVLLGRFEQIFSFSCKLPKIPLKW